MSSTPPITFTKADVVARISGERDLRTLRLFQLALEFAHPCVPIAGPTNRLHFFEMGRGTVKKILDSLLEMMVTELETGNRLILHGFGCFEGVTRMGGTAQNPRTLESVNVPPKHTVRFRPSRCLADTLSNVETERDPVSPALRSQGAPGLPDLMAAIHLGTPGLESPVELEDGSWANYVTAFEDAVEDVRSGFRFESWIQGRTPKRAALDAAQGIDQPPGRTSPVRRRRPKPEGPHDLTLNDLAYRVAQRMGATGKRTLWQEERAHFQQVKDVAHAVFAEIADLLASGCRLEFRDYFVFELRQRMGRMAQNPRTREQVEVPSKRVVKFKPGRRMRARVRGFLEVPTLTKLEGHPALTPGVTSLIFLRGKRLEDVAALADRTSLTSLYLEGCSSLTDIDPLAHLRSLTNLTLEGCSSLTDIDGLANLTSLTSLSLKGCSSLTNIDGLANLRSLTSLDLKGCSSLTNIDGLANLTSLNPWSFESCIADCSSLTSIEGLAHQTSLPSLSLKGCSSLADIDVLAKLTSLTNLDCQGCSSLTNIDAISNLTSLTNLNLKGCSSLTNIDAIANLTSLDYLRFEECSSLTNIDAIANLTSLSPWIFRYCFDDCSSLTSIEGLAHLTSLTSLSLKGCSSLTDIDVLAKLTSLTDLFLTGCPSLTNIDAIANLQSLTFLSLKGCSSLTHIDATANLTSLVNLRLEGCSSLTNVDGLANLTSLNLWSFQSCIDDCSSLTSIEGLAHLTSLTSLSLAGCSTLTDIDVLAKLTSLTKLYLRGCSSLANIDILANLTSLATLDLQGCSSLTNTDVLANLASLSKLRPVDGRMFKYYKGAR